MSFSHFLPIHAQLTTSIRTIDTGFNISFMTHFHTRPNEIMHVNHNTLSDSYHQCMET